MKIRYGLSALSTPVHIDSPGLERGLACGCTCPSCGKKLVARLGEDRVHHFAHHGQTAELCSYAAETELHIRAKLLIEQRLKVNLPLHVANSDYTVYRLYPVTNVRLEQFHLGKRPDLIVTINGFDFLIEIAVTHFADSDKQKVYRDKLLNAVEIDLSGYQHVDDADLEQVLEDALFASQSPAYAYWLSMSPLCPLLTDVRKILREETTKAVATYNNTVAATRQLESDLESLNKNYKQLGSNHSSLSRQYTDLLTLGDLDSQIQAKRQEVMTLEKRRNELNSQFTAVQIAETRLRQVESQLHDKDADLNEQLRKLNKKQQHVEAREMRLSAIEENLRTHELSLSNIEEILAEKQQMVAIEEQIVKHQLSLHEIKKLADYFKQLGDMDEQLAARLQVIESQVDSHNQKLMRLQGDIKELVNQKNYYLQEVAKLHRDLKQATQ